MFFKKNDQPFTLLDVLIISTAIVTFIAILVIS